MARQFVLVLNSDSASSCRKVGRHLGELYPTIHSTCRMHQLCISIVAIIKMAGLKSAVFCAALLLRRKRVQARVRRLLRRHVSEKLQIDHDPPDEQQLQQVRSIFDLIRDLVVPDRAAVGEDPTTAQKRYAAWHRLRAFFTGPVLDTDVIHHYCPFGCHASRADCVDQVINDLCTVFVDHPPTVPAWSKWTKIWPSIGWFSVFAALGNILPAVLSEILDLLEEEIFIYIYKS